ncbi:MAG: EXLDI protein [Acidipropionibacterium sp.]|nr:EXLDI protein [Acidipropionibacterium sp.]
MPTKNIYVADGDQGLFEDAAELAGSMSAAVTAGLRLYVAQRTKDKERTQMSQIEADVQEGPIVTTKRFTGRKLLRYELRNGMRVTKIRVYLTARNQLAVHTRNDPDWSRLSSPDENNPIWEDEQTWSTNWWETAERTLRVFPGIDSAAKELPTEVVDAIRAALAEPGIEDLDI